MNAQLSCAATEGSDANGGGRSAFMLHLLLFEWLPTTAMPERCISIHNQAVAV